SRYGALKSMLITIFGGLSMLGGLVLLTVISKTTSIQAMIGQTDLILNSPYLPLILVLILLGAFSKSAQFPFHIWLPDAMEAPPPVSAYLHSATMVKAGVYLFVCFSPFFPGLKCFFFIVSIMGILTLFWGSSMLVRQTVLKRVLASPPTSHLVLFMAFLALEQKQLFLQQFSIFLTML